MTLAVAAALLLTTAAVAVALPECLPACAGADLYEVDMSGADLSGCYPGWC